MAIILYVVAGALGIIMCIFQGWILLPFGAVGGFASFFYTAGPVKYKHKALGELSVFLVWGPAMMSVSYYILTGSWRGVELAAAASIPQGLWVSLVFFANNMTDINYDRSVGISTLATILKRTGTLRLYFILFFAIYLSVFTLIAFKLLPAWTLLVAASLPVSALLVLSIIRSAEIPVDADPQIARTGMVFGALFFVSFIIERLAG